MGGNATRPVRRRGHAGRGQTTLIVVALTILSLAVGCAGPNPSPTPSGSLAPNEPRASGDAASSPTPSSGIEPTGPGEPPSDGWVAGVEAQPLSPVARLEPTKPTTSGVLPDTAFRLTALDGSDPVALARSLVATPSVDLAVTASGDDALVTPRTPLAEGVAYRFSLHGDDGTLRGTWAVQTLGPLAVAGMLPYDEETGVPVNTGIEIRFNQAGIRPADLERHLEILPSVPGRIEMDGRTAAFVPDRPLALATLYTVTVRAGLPLGDTGEALARDLVTRFETTGARSHRSWLFAERRLVDATPRQPAVISVYAGSGDSDDEASPDDEPDRLRMAVHRLGGLEAAVEAWAAIEAAPNWSRLAPDPIDTSRLPRELEGEVDIRLFNDAGDGGNYVELPTALAPGWYVVTLTNPDRSIQLVLQVSDLALYSQLTTTRSLAWVNDLATGGPVAGARIEIAGRSIGRTGSDGVVVGATPAAALPPKHDPDDLDVADPAPTPIVVARAGGRTVFAPAPKQGCDDCVEDDARSSRWLVFEPDRWQYRTTDTVNAWGIVRDREGGRVPDEVEITLVTSRWTSQVSTTVTLASAVPDRNGAFAARLDYADLPLGDYTLVLRVGDEILAERGIAVTILAKPAWSMALETSRHAVVSGDSVQVTARASFFEGTPVAGARIRVASNGRRVFLRTDATGTGTASHTIQMDDDWAQSSVAFVAARPVAPEEGEISAYAEVAVFQAGVIVQSQSTVENGRLRVGGTVHRVAFDRYEAIGSPSPWSVDPYGRVVAGAPVRVRVVEHRSIRREAGTEYDWILKRVVPRYEYVDRETDRGTFDLTTDARGRFRLSLAARPDRAFELRISSADAQGRTTIDRAWADAGVTEEDGDWARIVVPEPTEGWGTGSRIRLSFVGGAGADDPSTYLWTTARAGLRSWALTSEPRYADTMRAQDAPGFSVSAVRFTGEAYVVPHMGADLRFRVDDRRLTVEVETDSARYTPGDTARIRLRTLGPDGQAVPASVYVAVIDEKLVAMGAVNLQDPLHALYAGLDDGVVGVAWTHVDPRVNGGEGGDTTGGGGNEARTDFRDWLLARIVHTGTDGRAVVEVPLSDDLTSWHVFAAGVTGSLLAGLGERTIPVSLPFFADVTVAESYLAADRPIIRMRAYGSALRASDTVTFTISSGTLPMAAVTVTAPAFQVAEVALPPLSVGTHRIRVVAREGTSGSGPRDALERTFDVVERRAVASVVTRRPLDGPIPVPAGEGLTTLTLTDGGRGRVLPVLEELAGADPTRGDAALAAGIAARTLKDAFGASGHEAALDLDLSPFRDGPGGYGLMPHGGDSLELLALAMLARDPRLADLSADVEWGELTTREERMWHLAALAAAGSASATEVATAAAQPDLTVHEQVALAIAALAAGDDALAATIEGDVLRRYGERNGPWVRVALDNHEESAVLTARLAIVAASLGDPVAAEMDDFLAANPPRRTILALERALAAQGWANRVPAADAVARLTIDGTPKDLRVRASSPVTVVLTPDQARTARLEPVSGAPVLAVRMDAPLASSDVRPPAWLRPVRQVLPGTTVGSDDLVVVTLTMQRPALESEGCWTVTETVPSGLVPIVSWDAWRGERGDGGRAFGPMSVRGQRLDFCLEPDSSQRTVRLRYAARVVTPGTYTWEPTIVQSALDPTVGALIPAATLTIRGER